MQNIPNHTGYNPEIRQVPEQALPLWFIFTRRHHQERFLLEQSTIARTTGTGSLWNNVTIRLHLRGHQKDRLFLVRHGLKNLRLLHHQGRFFLVFQGG